ncbi:UNVERIFIED_CONTAM: hypothetical protein BEN50_02055 [Euhalothece sp. KZN 001]
MNYPLLIALRDVEGASYPKECFSIISFRELTQELGEQMQEDQQLNEEIKRQLAKVEFKIEE